MKERKGEKADVISFAVPFEEDDRDPKTFFLDLDYVEEMWRMFRKVNGQSWPLAVKTPPRDTMLTGCSQGEAYRVLPYRTSSTVIRSRDYRIVQAILS